MSDDEAERTEDGVADEPETDEDGSELAPDGSTLEEVEAERAERLNPDNRPDGVEIDNTQRTFDEETGFFEDSEGADDADPVYRTASEGD